MGRPRERDHKADWLCKKCVDDKGDKFRNFAVRRTCFKCHVDKGMVFHSDVKQPPPRSLAHRQVQQQRDSDAVAKKLRDKDAKITALAAKVKEFEKGVATRDKKDKEEELDKDDGFEYTVEQLQAHRRMLLDFGKPPHHPDVDKLDKQILLQQEAKIAILPLHVRIAKADRKVKAARSHHENMVSKKAKLDEEAAAWQQKILEHKAGIEKAKEDIVDAERQREALYEELQPKAEKNKEGAQVEDMCKDILAFSEGLTDDVIKKVGANVSKSDLQLLLQGLAAQAREAAQERARAAEAAAEIQRATARAEEIQRATAAAATPAAGAAAPPSFVGRRPWSEEEEDCSDMEVDVDEEKVKQVLPPSMDDASRTQLMAVLATSVKLKKKVEKKKLGAKAAASSHKPGA